MDTPPALFPLSSFVGALPGECPVAVAPNGPQPNSQPLGGQVAQAPPQPGPQIAQTSDTLPLRYTSEQLKDYIMRMLGYPIWSVTLTPAQINSCINDALLKYSQYCPQIRYRPIPMVRGQSVYLAGEDCGLGVVNVDFVQPRVLATALYGNLLDIAVLPGSGVNSLGASGLDDYHTFLLWQKTFQRVTSIQPQWLWDDARQVLLISNTNASCFHALATLYYAYPDTRDLPLTGAVWVKEFALAKSDALLGDIFMRYTGAIPAPAGNSIQLDQTKKAAAEQKMKDLEDKLFKLQNASAPLSID